MPIVNGKHYPYTAAGRKAAKKAMSKKKVQKYHEKRGAMDGGRGSKLSVALGKKQY